MTAGAIIQKTWEELGEPSDLNPATIGVPKFINALNDAQDVVAQWIDNRGRKVFFRELYDSVQFKTVVLTGVMDQEAVGASIIVPVAVVPLAPGRYVDWIVRINGESRLVLASLASGGQNLLMLSSGFGSDVLGQDFVLAKRVYRLAGDDAVETGDVRVAEIERLFDMADGTQLTEVASRDFLTTPIVGVPGQWRHVGTGVMFDVAPETERTYLMHVVKLPNRVNGQTDQIELPEAFCQAVQMRMVWWGYRRMQDFQAAYASKKEFEEMMTRLATASWLNTEPDYFSVRSR